MKAVGEIFSEVERSRRTIAIAFFESKDLVGFYEGMLDFITGMAAKGFQLIFLNYNSSGNEFLRANGFSKIFEIDPDETVQLDFVELFIVFDWNAVRYKFPSKAKVLQLAHFLSIDANVCSYMRSYGLRADYTFLITANIRELEKQRRQLSRVASQGFPYEMLRGKGCLIPGGYPEMDALMNRIESRRVSGGQGNRQILFATTSDAIDSLLKEHGIGIIRVLLETFPEHVVVFRPTPSDRNHCHTRTVMDAYTGNPRFVADVGDLSETIGRSGLIIADSTALKEIFALVTTVPYIHCDFADKHRKMARFELGYRVSNERDMISAAKKVLNGDRIAGGCTEKYVAHPGRSAKYLLDNIDFILEDRINPKWFYYQNVNACKPIGKPEDYYKFIANYIQSTCVKSWSLRIVDHALERFPESAFLLGMKSKILFYMGRFDEAREVFCKADSINSHEVALTIDATCSRIDAASLRGIARLMLPPAVISAIKRLRRLP